MNLPLGVWIAYGVMAAALAMMAAYGIGHARGHTEGEDKGNREGYYKGYADCLERARACERTKESEVCDER